MRSLATTCSLLCACATLAAGCGKSLPSDHGAGRRSTVAAAGATGAGGVSTRNTTRLGGLDSAADAAAVAVATYPGSTDATRPHAVVLADLLSWPDALAASVLSGSPLHAPLLYAEGARVPTVSAQALSALRPLGAPQLSSTQLIAVGRVMVPAGYRSRVLAASDPATLAVAVERLWSTIHKRRPRRLIVTSENAPPAMTMPAAGLAAQTDTPILFAGRSSVPAATRAELLRLGRIPIYLIGPPSAVGERVAGALERFGPVTRIGGSDPASNAIAVARFTDGSFGWGVEEPGHGLAFANDSRPFDAPAAAPLAASGDYAPLLLLEDPHRLPSVLNGYLEDLQPGSPPSGPVHGVYNHGWLIGGEDALSSVVQARLDKILEISPQTASESAGTLPASPTEEEQEATTEP